MSGRFGELYHALPIRSKLAVLIGLIYLWFKMDGKIIVKDGKIVTFFPVFVYELAQIGSAFTNKIFDIMCYLQPSVSEWNENDPATSVEALQRQGGADLDVLKKQILDHQDIAFKEVDIVRLFDSLPPANAQELLVGKTYNGRILRTGYSALEAADMLIMRPLAFLGVAWGKRYRTQHHGDPLLFNWNKSVYVPLPVTGAACIVDVKWRGVTSAAMCYDNQCWKDYFRVLEHDPETNRLVLLGSWILRDRKSVV